MAPIIGLIDLAVNIYVGLIIASAIMSWLVAFNVINPHSRLVRQAGELLYRVTEPALQPIRRIMPDLGGLDLSPIVLILIIQLGWGFIRDSLFYM